MGEGTTLYFRIPREVWEPVDYGVANGESLKNACIVAQEMIECGLRPQRHDESQSLPESSSSLPTQDSNRGANLTRAPGDLAVNQYADLQVLEEEMQPLLCGMPEKEAVYKGVALLERFYVYETHYLGETEHRTRNYLSSLVMRNT